MNDLVYQAPTLGGGSYLAGLGMPGGSTPARVAPTREVVAGGSGLFSPSYPRMLSSAVDDISREVGWRSYDAMLTDPAVSSAVQTLILAIIADGVQVHPNIKPTPGKPEDARQRRSREMAEFGERYLNRPRVDLLGASCDLLMGCCYGSRLAEVTLAECETGDDAGLLVLDRLKGKPRSSWRYVVDPTNEVTGIAASSVDSNSSPVYLPRDKFAILSWMPREGDPRGVSILRPAYNAWSLKVQAWPLYFRHLCQFGGSALVGELGEGGPAKVYDASGNLVTAEQGMLDQLLRFQGGSAIAHGHGGRIYTVGGQGDGSAFTKAIELLDRQITQAMLCQTRATKEAQHGSKADSEGGADIFGLLVRYGRDLLASVLRKDVLRLGLEINFGRADAEEFCPHLSLGETEHQDRAAMLDAFTRAYSSGFIDDSQVPEISALLGIPQPDMKARRDRKAAQARPVVPSAAPPAQPEPAKGAA
jgi:hypothetical protein